MLRLLSKRKELTPLLFRVDPFSEGTWYAGMQTESYNSCLPCQMALTLKMSRKPAPENIACLCRLLNILANFSNLFLHTGKQCGP